jgi:lipopolysaccharide transport system ATP-binding protein
MSSELAIHARGLGKAYQIFARPEDRLKQLIAGKRRRYYREFWALRNLDLDIERGHTVGIVGRNGSGKSTLLQMICGTLTPTTGDLHVRGRIAALLELGAGFNPEFTGSENVFLNAQILGLSRSEIEKRFDRIAAFADIGPYIQQPVKTYSTGMYSRLAFAVAIHVDPEILVVDEALSVGDEAFQRKCFARIQEIREGGSTVLFVSHGASAVIELCDQAVLLDGGERLLTGAPKAVIAKYQKLLYAPAEKAESIRAEIRALQNNAPTEAPSVAQTAVAMKDDDAWFDQHLLPKSTVEYLARGAQVSEVQITTLSGKRVNVLNGSEEYLFKYRVHFHQDAYSVRAGMLVKTISGVELGGLTTHPTEQPLEHMEAGAEVEICLPFICRLTPGTYFFNAGLMGMVDGELTFLHRVLDAAMVRVQYRAGSLVTGLVDFSSNDPAKIVRLNNSALPIPKPDDESGKIYNAQLALHAEITRA